MIRKNLARKSITTGLTLAMVLCLTACGSSSDVMYSKSESMNSMVATDSAWDGNMYDYATSEESVEMPKQEMTGSGSTNATTATISTRKTIKTAKLSLETLAFDEFATALEQKVIETGSYFQYADVSGSSKNGRRYASYTVRVPESNLNTFLSGMEGIATVTNKTIGEQDVTLAYVDTESRIKSLEIERESLMELLEQAKDLDYIIRLQDRLTDVRYEIESYQSQLRTYDDKIAYSTVTLSVQEVKKVTEPEPETVWERIGSGWKNTMEDITEGAENFFVWFVVNIPYLVFCGGVITVAIVILKKKKQKRKQLKLKEKTETITTEE